MKPAEQARGFNHGQSRREFLKKTALAGGMAAAPLILPGRVFGADRTTAPSSKIVLGGIGIGDRGIGDLSVFLGQPDVQVAAVCDVRKDRREAAAGKVNERYGNTDCASYIDFRELLARPDIDAVLIATGDRWHAPLSIMAMRAGKDVYCEKPGALTIAEGQALVKAEKRYGRVFQTGAQRASERNYVIAGELLESGMLGEVKTVYAHLGYLPKWPRQNPRLPAQPEPPREELDWDMWIGPAPWRDYNPDYLRAWASPGWMGHSDMAAGIAQWGSHTILQCQLDLGLAGTSAVAYEFPENDPCQGIHIHFANGVKLVGRCGGWNGPCGIRYEGTEGWVQTADGYQSPEVSSPAFEQEFGKLVRDYRVRNQRLLDHVRDFIDCVKSRRTPVTSAGVAHRTMTTNLIMDLCLDLGRDLTWDPLKEEFIGDDEANRLRSRAARKAWMAV